MIIKYPHPPKGRGIFDSSFFGSGTGDMFGISWWGWYWPFCRWPVWWPPEVECAPGCWWGCLRTSGPSHSSPSSPARCYGDEAGKKEQHINDWIPRMLLERVRVQKKSTDFLTTAIVQLVVSLRSKGRAKHYHLKSWGLQANYASLISTTVTCYSYPFIWSTCRAGQSGSTLIVSVRSITTMIGSAYLFIWSVTSEMAKAVNPSNAEVTFFQRIRTQIFLKSI